MSAQQEDGQHGHPILVSNSTYGSSFFGYHINYLLKGYWLVLKEN